MKIRLFKLTSLLIVSLSFNFVAAQNLIFVNATSFDVTINVPYGGETALCRGPFSRRIGPGGVFVRDSTGCVIRQDIQTWDSIVHSSPRGEAVPVNFWNSTAYTHYRYGLYVIRESNSGIGFVAEGPLQERHSSSTFPPSPGTLFLVNATGHPINYFVDYPGFYCTVDKGNMPNSRVVRLGIGQCSTKKLYATVVVGNGQPNKKTNEYTGKTDNGTFIFRPKPGVLGEFEVSGPWKQMGTIG